VALKIIIDKKEKEGFFIFSLFGSLDSDTYQDFEKKINPILEKKPKGIVFNMEKLDYISSMGLSTIFKTKKAVEEGGGALAITNLAPSVKKVFEIVKAIPDYIFETMAEADEYLDATLSDAQKNNREKKN